MSRTFFFCDSLMAMRAMFWKEEPGGPEKKGMLKNVNPKQSLKKELTLEHGKSNKECSRQDHFQERKLTSCARAGTFGENCDKMT